MLPVVIVLGIIGGAIGAFLGRAVLKNAFCKGRNCLMETKEVNTGMPRQGLWLDPRTKLYLLAIFSIVMIDGKTEGISFWLKPALAVIPFLLLLSGRKRKAAFAYLVMFAASWGINLLLVPHLG